MGLDMYAYTVGKEVAVPAKAIDVDIAAVLAAHYGVAPYEAVKKAEAEGVFCREFAYWRKFNNLHDWMEDLYRRRGGCQTFNCVDIKLELEDLEALKADAGELAPTTGFFFGLQDDMTPEDVEEVHDFCDKAAAAIAEGCSVFYTSWW